MSDSSSRSSKSTESGGSSSSSNDEDEKSSSSNSSASSESESHSNDKKAAPKNEKVEVKAPVKSKDESSKSSSEKSKSESESESSSEKPAPKKTKEEPAKKQQPKKKQENESSDSESENTPPKKKSTEAPPKKKAEDKPTKDTKQKESKSKPKAKEDKTKKETKPKESKPEPPPPAAPQKDEPKTDRYGWQIEKKHISKKEKKRLEAESIKEREREGKWQMMISNWKVWMKKRPKKIHQRVKKGIPDAWRMMAWKYLLDPESIDNPEREPIQHYLDLGTPRCDNVIVVDIPRTMPTVTMFTKDDVRRSLGNVLRAYSNMDTELDYLQGMGFTAAFLLAYMDETSAFWCFKNLMNGPNHRLRDFYLNEFGGLRQLNIVWDAMLKDKFPKVHKNLIAKNIDHLIYTPSWYLTAFLNLGFSHVFKLRLFDRYICYGTRALVSLGLTIVEMNLDNLESGPMEVVIPILQNPVASKRMKNWRRVIDHWDKNFLREKQYKKYFKKTGVEYIP